MPITANIPKLNDPGLIRSFSNIGGRWQAGALGNTIPVTDPATGNLVDEVASLGAAEPIQVADVAAAVFADWAALLPRVRPGILQCRSKLILTHKEDLARIMVAKQGKPLSEARDEIEYGAAFIEFYAEETKRPNIEGITSHLADAEVVLRREPVGVAALIIPWSFPSAMCTRKGAAAMAADCAVVCHPSAETPFSALALTELAERAGMPAGVSSIVTGIAPVIVEPWAKDTCVRALSFTGSTEVGKLLLRQSADMMKRLVLELGGHGPVLVFSDSDLDNDVTEVMKAKWASSGQDCLGANRILVERAIYGEFCQRFVEATKLLTIGPGMEDCDIGPMMNENAVKKQELHVADAFAKGAKLGCGGKRHTALGPLFYEPTVLISVLESAKILTEETFAPVAAILPFDTEDAVTSLATATEYGLVACVHTQDPRRIYRLCRAFQFGMVAVNRTKVTSVPIPFGE